MGFSVIIPAYNSQATIARAIESVIVQTLPADEVIIVSDDCADYSAFVSDPKVKLASTSGVGTGAGNARDVGIEAASGDYIALLDADDAFHPSRLEVLRPLIERYGAAFTATRYIDDTDGTELPNINVLYDRDHLKPIELALSGMHTLVHVAFDRRRCPMRHDLSHAAQDTVFALKLYNYVDAVGYSSEPLYDYYRSANSFCNQAGCAERFLHFIDDVLDVNSRAHASVSGYKAFAVLRSYLECMRDAEVAVINAPELIFQEVLHKLAMQRFSLTPLKD